MSNLLHFLLTSQNFLRIHIIVFMRITACGSPLLAMFVCTKYRCMKQLAWPLQMTALAISSALHARHATQACSCRLVLSACVARHTHVRNTCPICPKDRLLSWFRRYHGCMHDCCSSCHDTAVCVGSFSWLQALLGKAHSCEQLVVSTKA